MSAAARVRRFSDAWRVLLLSQLREQPARLAVTVIAIALGVSLGAAVYLVNTAALNEFGLATKRLVGEADIVVRGPREGFSEQLFTKLAREPAVSVASPVLELEVALPGRRDTLKVLGLDPFRAAALQPALIGDIGGGVFDLFEPDALFLSSSAARQLQLQRGDSLQVIVGSSPKSLHVLGILAESTYPQALGVMDIASAQWTFEQARPLESHRFALAARAATSRRFALRSTGDYRRAFWRSRLKSSATARSTVTRAYRVNLNMLALVALWTGAFLVFSTQSLSVLRRRRSLASAAGARRDARRVAACARRRRCRARDRGFRSSASSSACCSPPSCCDC